MIKSPIGLGCAILGALPCVAAGQSSRVVDDAGRERRCVTAEKPNRLPAVADLIDSVAFVQRVRETEFPDTLFSLVFSAEGQLTTVRSMGTTRPVESAVELVRSSVRPQKAPGPWAIRLRLSPNPTLAVRIERSVYCPAAPANPAPGVRVEVVTVQPGDRLPSPGQRIRLDAEVSLDAAGVPTNVSVRRGSGMRDADDEMVRHLQAMRFLPALIDGLPIASWYRTDGARTRY